MTPEARRQAKALVRSISMARPHCERIFHSLQANGTYDEWHIEVQLLWSGYVAKQWAVRMLSFDVLWSNPVWSWLDYEAADERQQVLSIISTAVAAVPTPKHYWRRLSDHSMGTFQMPSIWRSRFRRVSRSLLLQTRAITSGLLDLLSWPL